MTTISNLYASFLASTGISTDTRNVLRGSLFFALKGANFDGNLFAEKALQLGAYKVVVDDKSVIKDENYILVDNALVSLQQLATYHRRKLNIPIIGITGTNGKTTTKELVNVVLSEKYRVFCTQGNLNNHIGVPLTLLSIKKGIDMGIVEMGANHPGEIAELCSISEPDFGLITNVGKAHLEGFGSFEGVKNTKAELYRYIENKSGTIFYNSDNTDLVSMLGDGASLCKYGTASNNYVFVVDVQKSSTLSFKCKFGKKTLSINSKLVGSYNLENVLASVTIGKFFNVGDESVVKAIHTYCPDNNRSQLIVSDKNKVIFDSYNANPTSMMAALNNFVEMSEEGKVVVLGEMKELGSVSREEHGVIVSFLKKYSFLKVILLGESYCSLLEGNELFEWYRNVEDLIDVLMENPIVNKIILVKGSRSNRLEKLKGLL